MGLALVHSRAGLGVDAPAITVEVHLGGGLPRMSLVGLPETAVREAKDRVKAALQNAGRTCPRKEAVLISPSPWEFLLQTQRSRMGFFGNLNLSANYP